MKPMRYVTAEEMRVMDETAVERYGIPRTRLMENAGKAVAGEAMKMARQGTVIIFSGYGNNGGDGFVAARHLARNSFNVKVCLVGRPKRFSPESEVNLKAIIDLGCVPETISTLEEIDKTFDEIRKPYLVIDAIFGIGLKGDLEDFYVRLIDRINSIDSPIISIDIPSGLDSDTGSPKPVAIKASRTVTLGFPKIGFKNSKAKAYVGELVVADIGLPAEKFA